MQKFQMTVGAVVVVVGAAPTMASATFYTDETAFLGSLAGPTLTDGYEAYIPDVQEGARTISLAGFEVSYDGLSDFGVSDLVDGAIGVTPISGDQHLRVNYGGGPSVTTRFTLDDATDAFGTYMTDIEITLLLYEVRLTDGSTLGGTASLANGNGGISYFGVSVEGTGTQIEWVEISMPGASGLDGVFFDQTTIVIPAPGVAAGLLSIGGLAVSLSLIHISEPTRPY